MYKLVLLVAFIALASAANFKRKDVRVLVRVLPESHGALRLSLDGGRELEAKRHLHAYHGFNYYEDSEKRAQLLLDHNNEERGLMGTVDIDGQLYALGREESDIAALTRSLDANLDIYVARPIEKRCTDNSLLTCKNHLDKCANAIIKGLCKKTCKAC